MTTVVVNQPIKYSTRRDALYNGEVDAHSQPHGYGELTITSKGQFERQVGLGMFVNGRLNGVGTFVDADGQKSTGEFIKGLRDGVGRVEHVSGDRYAGQLKGNKMHGLGTYTLSDGGVIFGGWVEGSLHDIALWVYADGSKAALRWDHDKLVSQTSGLIDGACLREYLVRSSTYV
jgi:hypothetical protein